MDKYHEIINELISRPNYYKVGMEYESYGANFVVCTIKKPYIKSLAVQALGSDDLSALENTLRLLEKVKKYEEEHGLIAQPSLDEQKHVKGYHRIKNEDIQITFKRTFESYVITNICNIDGNGFVFVEEPYDVTTDYCRGVQEEYITSQTLDKIKESLKEGEELYFWDDIRYLSGSAGIAVVKDGKIIKTKGLAMA